MTPIILALPVLAAAIFAATGSPADGSSPIVPTPGPAPKPAAKGGSSQYSGGGVSSKPTSGGGYMSDIANAVSTLKASDDKREADASTSTQSSMISAAQGYGATDGKNTASKESWDDAMVITTDDLDRRIKQVISENADDNADASWRAHGKGDFETEYKTAYKATFATAVSKYAYAKYDASNTSVSGKCKRCKSATVGKKVCSKCAKKLRRA